MSPSPVPRPAHGARLAWFVLAVLLLFSIAPPLNQFKVPPILPIVMQSFNVSIGQAGLLMSVYAITGLLLALPAGLIFQRAGYRLTSVLAGGSVVLGAVWGAFSSDFGSLLVSRVVEGIGTSFMAVMAPAIVAVWFPARRRGIAMGVWSNWVPLGTLIMLVTAPALAQLGTWRTVWWLGALYTLVATALALFFVKPPSFPADASAQAAQPAASRVSMGPVVRNGPLWLLSLTFGLFNMLYMGFTTYMPTYLNTIHNIPLAVAAQWAALGAVGAMIVAPFAGMWSDRIGSRKIPYLVGLALAGIGAPLAAVFTGNALIGLIVFEGLIAGLVPTNIFSAAVEVVGDERLGGLAMAVVMVGQNAGQLLGPAIFGALVESAWGWPLAFGSLALVAVAAIASGASAKLKDMRSAQSPQSPANPAG